VSGWDALGDGELSLHFVRNKERQEVDFLVADGRKPVLLVEAKLGDDRPEKGLLAIQRALRVPAVQLRARRVALRPCRMGPVSRRPATGSGLDVPAPRFSPGT